MERVFKRPDAQNLLYSRSIGKYRQYALDIGCSAVWVCVGLNQLPQEALIDVARPMFGFASALQPFIVMACPAPWIHMDPSG